MYFIRRTRSGNEEQAKKHKRETAQTCTHTERCKVSYSISDITYKLYILVFRRAKNSMYTAVAARTLRYRPQLFARLSRMRVVRVREKAEIYLSRMPNVVQPLHTNTLIHKHTGARVRIHAQRRLPNVGIYTEQFTRHLNLRCGRMNRIITIVCGDWTWIRGWEAAAYNHIKFIWPCM